jgi:superfamily II DNA/RNA helicase
MNRNFNNRRQSNNFGRSNNGGGRRNFRNIPKINIDRFINEAAAPAQAAPYVPENKFVDFQINDKLKANIVRKNYVTPTPIQDKAIPAVLAGKDVVGIANTGTGKTAAFVIPLIDKVMRSEYKEQVLIIVPTRELATQIDQEIKSFSYDIKIYTACCVGGASIRNQMRDLSYYNDFVIGTPGRLKDLSERGYVDFSKFRTVVLDEADQMLDMGFVNEIKNVLAQMPEDKHTLFFSATMNPKIETIIKTLLRDPVNISVKTQDTSKNIAQDVIRIKNGQNKIDVLHDLLSKQDFEKVLVFGRTKHGVHKLANTLYDKGHKAQSIHGDKSQSQRERALSDFKMNRVKVLVATDVAARGLDISDITHVINYDLPETHEDYIHRIGRTGRGGKVGKALTFID